MGSFIKEENTQKWLGLCHEGDNNTNLCYLWHNLPQEWMLDHPFTEALQITVHGFVSCKMTN